jgi:large subunit ribosomal protein L9
MEVILKKDVENLGYQDEMVEVKPGYARNFLVPKGLAVFATSSEKKMLEETVRQRAHKEEKVQKEANAKAAKLENETIKIGAKVGENGKIFGSVNTIQLADALKAAGHTIDWNLRSGSDLAQGHQANYQI